MDTQKYAKFNKIVLCVIFSTIIIPVRDGFSEENKNVINILSETYKLTDKINLSEVESIVFNLEKALEDCQDNYLTYRIKYRIGIIYFKSQSLEKANRKFLEINRSTECPFLIKISSMNMTGQIFRLLGKNEEAILAFKEVRDIIEFNLSNDKKSLSLISLLTSSLISSAEIYELQSDYKKSLNEYAHLISITDTYNLMSVLSPGTALIKDRMSQLNLKIGDVDKYINMADTLCKDYPEYERIPMIKLEVECVKFLRKFKNIDFQKGSIISPALFIAHVKESVDDKTDIQLMSEKIGLICNEYENTLGVIFVKYHYGWFLDAFNEKERAVKIFEQISTLDIEDVSVQERDVYQIIQEYARIQYAIMAGERTDYKDALRVLDSVSDNSNNPHISELKKTVTESIQTLKREVPKNEG